MNFPAVGITDSQVKVLLSNWRAQKLERANPLTPFMCCKPPRRWRRLWLALLVDSTAYKNYRLISLSKWHPPKLQDRELVSKVNLLSMSIIHSPGFEWTLQQCDVRWISSLHGVLAITHRHVLEWTCSLHEENTQPSWTAAIFLPNVYLCRNYEWLKVYVQFTLSFDIARR